MRLWFAVPGADETRAIVAPMGASSTHPKYDAASMAWSRARDVLAGEDAVKAAGEKYLPRLDSQSDEEYAAYKARASFFGATARTLAEYLDLVFRRAPVIAIGERKGLEQFTADCDGWGLELSRYARHVVTRVRPWVRARSDPANMPHMRGFFPVVVISELVLNFVKLFFQEKLQ